MIKAALKGGGLFAMGYLPGGPWAYRYLTREVMGTQRGHIFKLQRVWPDTVGIFAATAGTMEGKRFLFHECGWTPFPACMNYLTCGSGGVLIGTTVSGSRILERHVTESINEALNTVDDLSSVTPIPPQRIQGLDGMRWRDGLEGFLEETDTAYFREVDPGMLPVENDSIDLIYSGGALEHYQPPLLEAWLREAERALKPGGYVGVILDHRDHLYHFDKRLPFLYYYGMPDSLYSFTHGNPLLYHNRLLPGKAMEMIEAAGLQKVKVLRKSIRLDRWYEDGEMMEGGFGIERNKLAKSLREACDDDLKTAAAFYIYRKP
ncbi:MAG: class I SAM-dependent methyltransferase [Actinobacteria bacterium]|nr:class I SAM-dependent methyltransferase [Actinomycetota bacterium]